MQITAAAAENSRVSAAAWDVYAYLRRCHNELLAANGPTAAWRQITLQDATDNRPRIGESASGVGPRVFMSEVLSYTEMVHYLNRYNNSDLALHAFASEEQSTRAIAARILAQRGAGGEQT